MIQVEIDNGSGFCFGVTTAIKKAEGRQKDVLSRRYCAQWHGSGTPNGYGYDHHQPRTAT